jgi:hypothetical protein
MYKYTLQTYIFEIYIYLNKYICILLENRRWFRFSLDYSGNNCYFTEYQFQIMSLCDMMKSNKARPFHNPF